MPYNFFCRIQYFSKFYSALSCRYRGIHPSKIFQWSKSTVSRPIKYEGMLFMADGRQIVLGKFIAIGDCSTWLMARSIANHEGINTWIWWPDKSTELWKYLFLKVIVKSFQRLCHGYLYILFVKLTAEIGYCFWKIRSADCVSGG